MESAFQGEKKFTFGDDAPAVHYDYGAAKANLQARIRTIQSYLSADKMLFALSCPSRRYFRHDIWASYKGHRRGTRPQALDGLREYLEHEHWCIWKSNIEADDVIGIVATCRRVIRSGRTVIVTKDKDMLQIPGEHLNHSKLEKGIRTVTPEQGHRMHLYQTLTGDSTDNYPGAPGVGPKRATKLLDMAPTWETVVSEFVRRGKTEADALVQARVSKILTADLWDWANNKPKMWSPITE